MMIPRYSEDTLYRRGRTLQGFLGVPLPYKGVAEHSRDSLGYPIYRHERILQGFLDVPYIDIAQYYIGEI
jgi:hypothetical protein